MTKTGTPIWIDFGSTDFAESKAFYEQFFGWEFADGGEEVNHYQLASLGGAPVAGGMDVSGMTGPEGQPIPSSWTVYLAVDDIDARVRRAAEHGGTVVMDPDAAGDFGRFALVLDPTGAVVGLWQDSARADSDCGDHELGTPGTPVWYELMTQNHDAAAAFYRDVFDFEPVRMPGDDFVYSTNGPGESATSGICDASSFIPPELDSFWRVYFSVESCDPAVERVRELGGVLLDGPHDSPFGRIATVADPAGASFQICATTELPGGDR